MSMFEVIKLEELDPEQRERLRSKAIQMFNLICRLQQIEQTVAYKAAPFRQRMQAASEMLRLHEEVQEIIGYVVAGPL